MHLPEFDVCPMQLASRASAIGGIEIQCPCIGFVLFHSKKCAFIMFINLLTSILHNNTFLVFFMKSHKNIQRPKTQL